MREYRVKVTVRNNLLLSAIEAAGYKSQSDFARAAGLTPSRVNDLVGMRDCPVNANGEFSAEAKIIMEVLGAAPSDLWTDEQLYMRLRRNSASAEFNAVAVRELLANATKPIELEAPDAHAQKGEILRDVERMLETLKPREAKVLRLIFGIGCRESTLEECGKAFGVTKTRIRDIATKALRKLRARERSELLASHMPNWSGEEQ